MKTRMITKTVSLLCMTALCFGPSWHNDSLAQTTPLSIQPQWQNAVTSVREDNDLIGVGGAILYKGKIAAIASAGVQIKGKETHITIDDKWHLGSISKSMTATMIARLVEQDILSWDIDIASVFKDMTIHPDWQGVKLEHFLTHTSGAPANFPKGLQTVWPVTKLELRKARTKAVSDILSKPPQSIPGDRFSYSNVGVTIAAVLAEHITDKSWEALMRDEVFTPLAMTSAGFGAPRSSAKKSQPWGHRNILLRKIPKDPKNRADNTPVMGPAGTIHMNLRDVLKFGQVHLDGMKGNSDFLTPESFKRLHTAKLNHYAYGWVSPGMRKWADGPIIWHNGTNTMWYALLIIAPDKDAVFIMTSNDGNYKKAEKSFMTLLEKFATKL